MPAKSKSNRSKNAKKSNFSTRGGKVSSQGRSRSSQDSLDDSEDTSSSSSSRGSSRGGMRASGRQAKSR